MLIKLYIKNQNLKNLTAYYPWLTFYMMNMWCSLSWKWSQNWQCCFFYIALNDLVAGALPATKPSHHLTNSGFPPTATIWVHLQDVTETQTKEITTVVFSVLSLWSHYNKQLPLTLWGHSIFYLHKTLQVNHLPGGYVMALDRMCPPNGRCVGGDLPCLCLAKTILSELETVKGGYF